MQYSTYNTTPLSNSNNNLKTTTNDYFVTNIIDILNDPTSLNYFIQLANKTQYSTCSIASIVPSTTNPTILCQTGTAPSTNCILFTGCADTCISLSSIFNNYRTTSMSDAAIKLDLTTYSPSCNQFQIDIFNLYQNWWKMKYNILNDISGVSNRAKTVDSNVMTLLTDIPILSSNFNNVFKNLNTDAGVLLHPVNGMLAGTNCLVVG